MRIWDFSYFIITDSHTLYVVVDVIEFKKSYKLKNSSKSPHRQTSCQNISIISSFFKEKYKFHDNFIDYTPSMSLQH